MIENPTFSWKRRIIALNVEASGDFFNKPELLYAVLGDLEAYQLAQFDWPAVDKSQWAAIRAKCHASISAAAQPAPSVAVPTANGAGACGLHISTPCCGQHGAKPCP